MVPRICSTTTTFPYSPGPQLTTRLSGPDRNLPGNFQNLPLLYFSFGSPYHSFHPSHWYLSSSSPTLLSRCPNSTHVTATFLLLTHKVSPQCFFFTNHQQSACFLSKIVSWTLDIHSSPHLYNHLMAPAVFPTSSVYLS